jgi:LysR family transcriptional regulator, benzoate and cis,cis-muconate-responsive activator of ben and cat genes
MPRNSFLELRHLHYFLAVAEEQHFGRAAERLGIAQPPLSQQMQRLETTLGVELFDRSQRRMRLTAAGRALAARAASVLEATAALREDVRQASLGRSGVLRVGVGASAALGIVPGMIAGFRAQHPAVVVQLDDVSSRPHEERVRQRLIDVALQREAAPIDGLRATVVRDERLVVVLPRTHRFARRRTLKLRELRGEPFVLFPREASPSFYDELQAACARAGFIPHIVEQATEWPTVAAMVALGTGITVAPDTVAVMPREGAVYVRLNEAGLRVQLLAVTRDEDDPLVSAFVTSMQ